MALSTAPTKADVEPLTLAGCAMRSRLLLGTGGFPSLELMAEAIRASGSELVTVALDRSSFMIDSSPHSAHTVIEPGSIVNLSSGAASTRVALSQPKPQCGQFANTSLSIS